MFEVRAAFGPMRHAKHMKLPGASASEVDATATKNQCLDR